MVDLSCTREALVTLDLAFRITFSQLAVRVREACAKYVLFVLNNSQKEMLTHYPKVQRDDTLRPDESDGVYYRLFHVYHIVVLKVAYKRDKQFMSTINHRLWGSRG